MANKQLGSRADLKSVVEDILNPNPAQSAPSAANIMDFHDRFFAEMHGKYFKTDVQAFAEAYAALRTAQLVFIERVLRVTRECDLSDHGLMWCQAGDNQDGEWTFAVNCSDCFAWGCWDAEDITPENIDLYEVTLRECETLGESKHPHEYYPIQFANELFAARVRKMRPQGASYGLYPLAMWPLFDACGTEREAGFGNPHTRVKAETDAKERQAKGWLRSPSKAELLTRAETAESALRDAKKLAINECIEAVTKLYQESAENAREFKQKGLSLAGLEGDRARAFIEAVNSLRALLTVAAEPKGPNE